MCQTCEEALKKYFPDIPEEHRHDFLMECTAYGFGDVETIEKQLKVLYKKSGGDYKKCFEIAEKMTADFEKWMRKTAHLKEEPDNIFFVLRKSGSKRYLDWERTGTGAQSKYQFKFVKKSETKSESGRSIDKICNAAERAFRDSLDVEHVGFQRKN